MKTYLRTLILAVLSASLIVGAHTALATDVGRSAASLNSTLVAETQRATPLIRQPSVALAQDVAILRKRQIAHPNYELDLALNAEGEPFEGKVTIDFDLVPQGSPVTIDFSQGEILDLRVNGKSAAIDYNDSFISIPEAQLNKGTNEVVIQFRHPYSHDGLGLYYFKDPLDQKVYTYTQFEIYNANRVLPVFDQPNLKGTFTLTVEAPARWTVVSNMAETAVDKSGDRARWHFPKTPVISSYLMAIHAGEYTIFDMGKYKDISMRLLPRTSLKDNVPVKEWETQTRQGFDFYENFFGIPYVFGKYDQLIVPDFYYGGMENIGAVTYKEDDCCTPGKKTLNQRTEATATIFHELGHMWFGNLVTMDWWNDLWLNESFTELVTTMAMDAASHSAESQAAGSNIENPWLGYFWLRKAAGYHADDLVTTHSIKTEAPDTEIAFSLVDGITYAKGGSVLRQLAYYLGADQFRLGIQNYMKKYAYSNTTLADLLQELSIASRQDLSTWAKEWLETTGTNRIAPEIACQAGQIQSLTLHQTPGIDGQQLRTHKFQVALYNTAAGKLSEPKVLDALVTGATTEVASAQGLPCPDLVLPNYGDHAFIQVLLDSKTKETAQAHLLDIADPLSRALIWEAVRQEAFDGQSALTDYTNLVLHYLADEPNAFNTSGVISRLSLLEPWLYLMKENPRIAAWQQSYSTKLAELAASKLTTVEPGSEAFLDWFGLDVSAAQSPEQLNTIKGWLIANQAFGWTLDQPRRWKLISSLAAADHPDAQSLLDQEAAADASSQGQISSLTIRSILADRPHKLQLIKDAIDPQSQQSLPNRQAIMSGALQVRQTETFKQNAQPALAMLLDGIPSMDTGLSGFITTTVVPMLYTCAAPWNSVVDEYLEQPNQFSPAMMNGLRLSKQNNETCMKVKQRLSESLPSNLY